MNAVKNWLSFFQKKEKLLRSSYNESDFVGKYRQESKSIQKKDTASPDVADALPPTYVPVASAESFLPEQFTTESSKASWIRSVPVLVRFFKILLILVTAFGTGVLLWYITHRYQLVSRFLHIWKAFQAEVT